MYIHIYDKYLNIAIFLEAEIFLSRKFEELLAYLQMKSWNGPIWQDMKLHVRHVSAGSTRVNKQERR